MRRCAALKEGEAGTLKAPGLFSVVCFVGERGGEVIGGMIKKEVERDGDNDHVRVGASSFW